MNEWTTTKVIPALIFTSQTVHNAACVAWCRVSTQQSRVHATLTHETCILCYGWNSFYASGEPWYATSIREIYERKTSTLAFRDFLTPATYFDSSQWSQTQNATQVRPDVRCRKRAFQGSGLRASRLLSRRTKNAQFLLNSTNKYVVDFVWRSKPWLLRRRAV